jgi:hypothetical protein
MKVSLQRSVIKIVFISSLFISSANAGVCYTAVGGFTAVANTEANLLGHQASVMDKIGDVGSVAKKRADKEIEIAEINNKILRVRKRNLLKLKEIEFYKGK